MRKRRFVTLLAAAALAVGHVPAAAQTFTDYHCRDGSQFMLGLFKGDRGAYVQLDGKAIALKRGLSLSGTRYVKGDLTLRLTKAGATLKRGKQLTECSPQ